MLDTSVVDQFDVGSEKSLTTKGTKSHEGNTYKLIPSWVRPHFFSWKSTRLGTYEITSFGELRVRGTEDED